MRSFGILSSSLKSQVSSDLPPLGLLFPSPVLCFQSFAASFWKLPGWGYASGGRYLKGGLALRFLSTLCACLPQAGLGVISNSFFRPTAPSAGPMLYFSLLHGEIRFRNGGTRSRHARQIRTGDRTGSPRPAPHQLQNLLRLLHALR